MRWHRYSGMMAVGAVLIAGSARAADVRPNFVVILTEAQGWPNTSVAMDDRLPASKSTLFTTPAVERLAREGMRFAYGYALSPRCTPSRAALFTGRGPALLHMTYVGVGREAGPVRTALIPPEPILELPTSVPTVADVLKGAGYTTAHFGKWHVGRVSPSRHGFDESDGPTNNGGPDNVASPNPKQAYGMTERGIAFMTRARAEGRPFYLQLSHYPNQDRKEGGGRSRETERKEADEIDRTVMLVLEALDRLGLAGHTYVIYTSDHGGQGRMGNEPLSGGKGSVLEGGLRVPFLIRGPGVAANVCSRVPVTACDLLPTIAEFAQVKTTLPAGIEGGSLAAVLRDSAGRGTVTRLREELVFHFPHYDLGNGGPATAIMLGHYKLIRNYERNTRRLYDLEGDPAEAHDLAAKLPEKTAELDARLSAYLKEVGAQMAKPNPDYDPAKADDPNADDRRGGKGGKQGKKRE
ncbi:MAG: sulfatase-like hydrolase/transferase [Verrucomicrobia bacterium]|nr:sulfatase-like hydrolase/transferase [Verrucomicrobiota bacterium]